MKKVFACFSLITIAATTLWGFPTQRAYAQFGIEASAKTVMEQAQRTILELMKKRLLDLVVDEIVQWIQGGGTPLFVQNWQTFLGAYGNIVTGDLIQKLGLGAICKPFGIQLQLAVLQPPRFTKQISCTLDQIVGNMVNFYNNFRAGGFIAYRELWQPQNNFYGALLLAMDEKETQIADQRFAALQEAQAGGGFLGTRKCDRYGHCYITTPGTQIGAAAAKIIGADIDYIVNAQDLAAYIAAISDAFINRLIREGVGGLQAVVANNAPPLGYIPQQPRDRKLCAGLTDDALISCLAAEGAHTNNIKAVLKAYLTQINATLTPLQDAEARLETIIPQERTLVARLDEVLTCQNNRTNRMDTELITERAAEQKLLDDLTQMRIDINQATTALINIKLQFESPPSRDPIQLNQLFTSIASLLSQQEAIAYQNAVKEKQTAITTKVAQRLPQLQIKLQQCLNS